MALPIFKRFDTTADRIAYDFDANDRGSLVEDLETGNLYFIKRSGAGADTCVPLPDEYGYVPLSLGAFVEVDANGDVGAITANGGVLASDTTPILRADANESFEVVWAACKNDAIAISVSLPGDIDDTRDAFLDLTTVSGGTTDAATFTVETSWNGAALVSDTATGAASTTAGTATATIAAADVPASPVRLTVILTPTAHTTDTKSLLRARLRYYRK